MKSINRILGLALSSTLLFAACQKTVDSPSLTEREKALIGNSGAGKIWKLYSLSVPKAGDALADSSIMLPCADSALMAFDIYNAYQLANVSKTACDSIAVPYSIGNWALSASGDSLLLRGQRNLIWKLEILNDSTLKAVFRDSISPDKNWLKTIILK